MNAFKLARDYNLTRTFIVVPVSKAVPTRDLAYKPAAEYGLWSAVYGLRFMV